MLWGRHRWLRYEAAAVAHSLEARPTLDHDSMLVWAARQADQGDEKRQRHQRRSRPFRLFQRDNGADDFVFRFHSRVFRLFVCQ